MAQAASMPSIEPDAPINCLASTGLSTFTNSKKGYVRHYYQKSVRRLEHVQCAQACRESDPVLDIHLRDARKRWLNKYLAKEAT